MKPFGLIKEVLCLSLLCCGASSGITDEWIVVDSWDSAPTVEVVGSWVNRRLGTGYDGTYDHDGNELKGTKSVRFIPDLPTNSTYNVYLNWVSNNNRASNVPVTITHADGATTVVVNQRNTGDWLFLGAFYFAAGMSGNVLIETTGTDGYVIADAVAWEAIAGQVAMPEINVFATVSETMEGDAAQPAVITMTRSTSTNVALGITLDISGTATPTDDYLAIAEDNLFPVGASTRTFVITPTDDGEVEGDETISMTLQEGTGYTLGSNHSAQVILHDSSLDNWRAENFSGSELADINVSGAMADPDDDENENLGEFFADSNPNVADDGLHTTLSHDGTNVVIQLVRNPAAAGLEVEFKTTDEFDSWWPLTEGIVPMVESDGFMDTLTYMIPPNIDTKQFWKAEIHRSLMPQARNGIAFWSFDTLFDGTGDPVSGSTLEEGFASAPALTQSGSNAGMTAGGAESYFGPDGNSWTGSGNTTAPGHSLIWNNGSQSNRFSIGFSTWLQEDVKIRFDIRSSVTNFLALTYDTGTGPLPVPDADLSISADGAFQEWAIDLSAMDAVNGRSDVTLTWSFEDLTNGAVQIDHIVVSAKGRPKSQLVRNLEAGRLQTVVTLGTSITANGAWVGHLSEALESQYGGLATVLNSGASGKTSAHGVANINSLVIQKKPDTMFIEYGINDSVERFSMSVLEAQSNLEYIIDTTLANFPQCEIILMTMTPGDKYEPGHTSYRKDIQDYYAMYRAVARERGFMAIDHYSSWIALQTNDVLQFNSYVPDTIHPGAAGNAAVVSPVVIHSLGIASDDQEENE